MAPQFQHMFTVFVCIASLFAIPAGLILKRLGISFWWALLCYVPITALFGIWILAFVRWPLASPAARAEP